MLGGGGGGSGSGSGSGSGENLPSSSYTSTSNIMTLYLTTDFSVNDKGFKASWKEVN